MMNAKWVPPVLDHSTGEKPDPSGFRPVCPGRGGPVLDHFSTIAPGFSTTPWWTGGGTKWHLGGPRVALSRAAGRPTGHLGGPGPSVLDHSARGGPDFSTTGPRFSTTSPGFSTTPAAF